MSNRIKSIAGAFLISMFCGSAAHAQSVIVPADTTKKVLVSADTTRIILSSDTAKVITTPIVRLVKPKPPKPIRNELSLGLRLNTNGWSVFSDYGRVKTNDLKHADMFHNVFFLQFEVTEKKDARETKIPSETTNTFGGSSNYIYGKINNLYAIKFGVGYRKLLAGKPDPGCVSIHWSNTIGGLVGLLKPYYIEVDAANEPQMIKYSTSTEQDFLNQSAIQGAAGFSKGWGEVKIIPGGYARTALHFDFSTNRRNVLGVEAGGNAEFYSQKAQLMAFQNPKALFMDLFVSFQYGRRW